MSIFGNGLVGTSRAVIGIDVTGANAGRAPTNCPIASYVTGSGGIPASPSFWAAHPSAVRIDQSPSPSVWDKEADVDDFERGAVQLVDLAPRARQRILSFQAGTRPGQRRPLVYASASNITIVVDALIAGGVTSGVGLWVANWSFTEAEAFTTVLNAAGPFPIEAFQFSSGQFWDTDVFCEAWLTAVSGAPPSGPTKHTVGPGQSIAEIAGSRNMLPISWLVMQQHFNPSNAQNLAGHSVARSGDTWFSA